MRANPARCRVFKAAKLTAVDVVASIRSLRAKIPTTAVVIHLRQLMPSSFSPRNLQGRRGPRPYFETPLPPDLARSCSTRLSPLSFRRIASLSQSSMPMQLRLRLCAARTSNRQACLACTGPATQSSDQVPAMRCVLLSQQDRANARMTISATPRKQRVRHDLQVVDRA